MKFNSICFILLTVIILVGCVKESIVENTVKTIRSVDTEISEADGTKALLQDRKRIEWDLYDEIGVFSDAQEMVAFQNVSVEGKPTSRFSGDDVSGTEFYAIYPKDGYDPSNPMVINCRFVQPVAGESPKITIPMVAKLENGVFRFKQTMGILHFAITGSKTVEYVELSCNNYDEKLYGNGIIDLRAETPVFKLNEQDGIFNMTYLCPEPYTILEDETWNVFFPVPPMEFTKGIRIRIRCIIDGKYVDVEKILNKPVSIHRAEMKSFTATDIDDLLHEHEAELLAQREALIQFYHEMGGDKWTNNTNWCSDKPVNEWYGVICDGDYLQQYVTTLFLGNNNLNGKLSSALFSIPHLATAFLDDNYISEVDLSEPVEISGCLNLNRNPITTINLSGCTKLKELLISGTPVSSIDLSALKELEWLDCGGSLLKEIDVTNSPHLKALMLQSCDIKELDITHNPELFQLDCGQTRLKELDFSNSGSLENLFLSFNDFTSIDISSCLKLKQLDLMGNENLTDLVLGDHPNLVSIDITGARIESLDVSRYPNLEHLGISWTGIKSINLDNNPNLLSLSFFSENIQSLDVSKLTKLESLDIGGQTEKMYSDDYFPTIDVSHNPNLRALQCCSTTESVLDLSNNLLLESVALLSNRKLKTIYVNPSQTFSCTKPEQSEYVFKGEGEPPYSSTDYSADRTWYLLQKASRGKGIDLVFMGDGFTDRLHEDGTYDQYMNYAMEEVFKAEPFKSFRDLFNVYCVRVVSKNEVYSSFTETTLVEGFDSVGYPSLSRSDRCIDYAKCALGEEKLGNATVLVVTNRKETVSMGIATMSTADNFGLCIVTLEENPAGQVRDVGETIRHEIGHAFAKLADEYSQNIRNEKLAIPDDEIVSLRTYYEPLGWYKNVDFTDNPDDIKWSRFLKDERYSGTVGIFEGGFDYNYGVFRPSVRSIMNEAKTGDVFNAPSREAIFCKIHELAFGDQWKYDYEEFVQYDAVNRNETKSQMRMQSSRSSFIDNNKTPHKPPVIVQGSWRDIYQ